MARCQLTDRLKVIHLMLGSSSRFAYSANKFYSVIICKYANKVEVCKNFDIAPSTLDDSCRLKEISNREAGLAEILGVEFSLRKVF
ncbi:hypothetical protein M5K25_005135 [Dendrobium thyrsiflorum]|uniref:Uncharacterized protein n=1 Tax=Dendrobium thyrsiflorum TaxID=117978 RepID=A0ABD0VGP4_DENTH